MWRFAKILLCMSILEFPVLTIEAIKHLRRVNKPFVVAITKCDLPTAGPAKVRTDLLQHEIVVEEFGGDIQCVEVSSVTGDGLNE